MKNKGFTLIELLAVIVILAIIALIAVPIVINIINDSRENASARSRELYATAVKNAVAKFQLNGGTIIDGHYKKVSDTEICRFENNVKTNDCIPVEVEGEKPVVYTMEIESGEITSQTIQLKANESTYTNDGSGWTKEGESVEEEPTYAYLTYTGSRVEGPIIGDDASSLPTSVPDANYYLKFKLDDENKVTNSYACVIFDDEEYCLEGGSEEYYGWDTDEAHSTGNVKKLYDIQSGVSGIRCGFTNISYQGSFCTDESVVLAAYQYGVSASAGDLCYLGSYGGNSTSYCDCGGC